MKLSELIKRLQEMKKKRGDCEVMMVIDRVDGQIEAPINDLAHSPYQKKIILIYEEEAEK